MKKLKELNTVHTIFVDSINELDTKIQTQIKKIKQEYQQNVINEKIQLLIEVCNGEGLDFEQIKKKYLKSKELNYIPNNTVVIEHNNVEDDLLDKIEINGEQYYYEAKENGIVYNSNSKQIGIFTNGQIIFN